LNLILHHLAYLRLHAKSLSAQISLYGNDSFLAKSYEFWPFFEKMLEKVSIVDFFFHARIERRPLLLSDHHINSLEVRAGADQFLQDDLPDKPCATGDQYGFAFVKFLYVKVILCHLNAFFLFFLN